MLNLKNLIVKRPRSVASLTEVSRQQSPND